MGSGGPDCVTGLTSKTPAGQLSVSSHHVTKTTEPAVTNRLLKPGQRGRGGPEQRPLRKPGQRGRGGPERRPLRHLLLGEQAARSRVLLPPAQQGQFYPRVLVRG